MTETKTFSYKQGNQTCLLLSAALRLSIPFTSRQNKTEHQLTNVPVSSDVDVSGDCNSTAQQEMTLYFYNNWKLRFVFVSTPSSGGAPTASIIGYTLDNITLTYGENPLIFYNSYIVNYTGAVTTVSSQSFETPLKAPAAGYFHCDSTMETTFTDGVKLEVKDLRFQAFRKSESGDFSGDVSTCNALSKKDRQYTVYVIVALGVVAIIAVIVVVGVMAMKKRKRNSYQHME